VPDARIHFSIVDDQATPGSGGAQLSFADNLTDDDGTVTLQVIAAKAGSEQQPLTFTLRASSQGASLDIPIFVTSSPLASVQISPVFPEGTDVPVDTTYITFYDGTSCASVTRSNSAIRQARSISPLDYTAVVFTSVVTSGVHAVMGVAVGKNNTEVARGCADVSGASLSPGQTLQVLLPLARTKSSPEGVYQAVSEFDFPTPLPGTVSARDVWRDLSNDACDPAQMWLDCTIDALSESSIEDPLDCQPVRGGEGRLGELLMARRGSKLGTRTCADQQDNSGNPSLDAKTYALFPAVPLDAFHLPKLPDELTTALTHLTIESTLSVSATSLLDHFNIDHILTAIDLPNATTHSRIAMASLAPPVRKAAFVSGTSLGGQLLISPDVPHGFTLGLGAAARFTFAASSLAPRAGGIADVSAFVAALVKLATRKAGETMLTGCDALDALLCDDVGEQRDCVRTACLAGTDALTQRLDSSFTAMDGVGLDLFLSGSAPLVDSDSDRRADALGSITNRGSWTNPSAIKSRKGNTSLYGTWTAKRLSAAQ
jgi:hypothetical protein